MPTPGSVPAIYSNARYPFSPQDPDPPRIPQDNNPAGSYRTTFTLPRAWNGREVFIHFGGVSSAFYLWVNGEPVGYSQGSKTPAEFRITPYLLPGRNVVAAEVYPWSDGSYLEAQDFWRLSGIHRDVFVYSTPKVHIRDYFARTGLDASYRDGTLTLEVEVRDLEGKAGAPGEARNGYSVVYKLFDGSRLAASGSSPVETGPGSGEARFESVIENVRRWSAETPELYDLVISLKNPSGRVVHSIGGRIGFGRWRSGAPSSW